MISNEQLEASFDLYKQMYSSGDVVKIFKSVRGSVFHFRIILENLPQCELITLLWNWCCHYHHPPLIMI